MKNASRLATRQPAIPEFGDPSSLLPGLDVLYAAAPQPLLDAAAMTGFMTTPSSSSPSNDRLLTPLELDAGRPTADDDHRPLPRTTVATMTDRPDLFLLNVAFDCHRRAPARVLPRPAQQRAAAGSSSAAPTLASSANRPTAMSATGGSRSSKRPVGSSPSPTRHHGERS